MHQSVSEADTDARITFRLAFINNQVNNTIYKESHRFPSQNFMNRTFRCTLQ